MTPQGNFMVNAPIRRERMDQLKTLLASMTKQPGTAEPDNAIVPFKQFDTLHYARFVILDDQTVGDFECLNKPIPDYRPSLAFLGDCDGPADAFLAKAAEIAGKGLCDIFSHCDKPPASPGDVLAWMKQHSVRPAAAYVNTVGRTVQQIKLEHALRMAVIGYLKENPLADDNPQATYKAVVDFVDRSSLKPPAAAPTPSKWRRWLAIAVPVVAIVVLFIPLFVPFLIFLAVLRWYEKTEKEIIRRPADAHEEELGTLEDYDVSNQFTVLGSVKPSPFRRCLQVVLLLIIRYVARHIYTSGHLGRVRSIHFARWVYLDGGHERVMFASNYDGSLDSYMDDFINKAGFGLNLAFACGIGYPRTTLLIWGGAKEEQKFKYTLRRHQVPTQVWYKAYPGLTAPDLARNTRVREGIERRTMNNAEISAWLRDL